MYISPFLVYNVSNIKKQANIMIDKFFEIIDNSYESVSLSETQLRKLRWIKESILCDVIIRVVYDITEVVEHANNINNFLYDRKTGKFFCNVNTGYHFILAEYILIRSGLDIDEDYEDYFIMNGYGAVLSSISELIMIGENTPLTAQEKIIFKSIPETELYKI